MISKLQEQIFLLTTKLRDLQNTPRVKLFMVARGAVGTDVTPLDRVPDDVACAEVATTLMSKVISMPLITGTYTLFTYLKQRTDKFEMVQSPLPGDIVISPTGLGNGKIKNGHVGIMGVGVIYSNNSLTGKLDTHFTLSSWKARYSGQGGFPVYYFRLK